MRAIYFVVVISLAAATALAGHLLTLELLARVAFSEPLAMVC